VAVLDSPDAVTMRVGERRWLTMDFGNLPELQGQDIASAAIAVTPATNAPATSGQAAGAYAVGAWFTAAAAGEWTVTVTATLADGSVVPRRGTLVVED
jgi:hypothetical protein